ncbi:MAG: fumarylacetoacetate hydrolase family protein [Candidatus Omnitrophica bacterium]|nr:fumarylacetoacetate hydrolase family protein [Candidatus Omnitrophota bacterium]MDD5429252.1 fumarylacetoacetate hydrolase family protein [Candidatus Omnitrophota bacterium]
MKIVNFLYKNRQAWGAVAGERIKIMEGCPYEGIKFSGETVDFRKCKLLAPANPGKIVLVGLNYRDHAKELSMKIPKEPVIFLKPATALSNPGGRVVYPKGVKRLDYEAELAVVIKRKTKNVSEAKSLKYILGYTCLNDITARDLQTRDGQWTRAKSFDGFAPLGPWVETDIDCSDIKVQLYLNGKLKQNSSTKNFIFSLQQIISFISNIMTLLPGDVISTGTPSGVGPMRPGDTIEVKIEGVGTLENYVCASRLR